VACIIIIVSRHATMEVNMTIIKKVVPYDGYKVFLELTNGHGILVDFESKLDTLRFCMLENKDVFKRVYTDGFSIMWNKGKLKVSVSEIIEMLQYTQTLFMVG